MQTRPITLTIAGSDSGGGAGIQADLKTFALLGCFGTSAITAVTAQNTRGVQGVVMLETAFITQQIDSVAEDLRPAAVKTGMLGSHACVEAVAEAIERHRLVPLVVDPVMIAKGGDSLVDDDAVEAIRRRLLPLATIVTPNRFEAARLVGFEITDVEQAGIAARMICQELGAQACVVKGVREDTADQAIDTLYVRGKEDSIVRMVAPWQPPGQANTHGSGCTFSAAITAGLAQGLGLVAAVESAKAFTHAAIASSVRLGGGVSPVDHLAGKSHSPRSSTSR